jgi:Zn-finger nucleic acid-binding protein
MSSPIDGSPMREVERYGVKIDICQSSGGIWLDKGELEKIMMMIREEALRESGASGPAPMERRDERPSFEHQSDGQRPQRRKRDSVLDNLMDIFDV